MEMKVLQLPKTCFFDEDINKRIIVIHHTAGASGESSINWWKTQQNKVSTSFVIDRNGLVIKAFEPSKWGRALGIKQQQFDKFNLPNINNRLEQISVQIELANWGQLIKKDEKYYTFSKREIIKENVVIYNTPFRGSKYYEKYTNEQIESLRQLILTLNNKYPSIKLDYNSDMWDVSKRALVGTWGVWTHVSFRNDKSDCHPQPELIQMLKNLK